MTDPHRSRGPDVHCAVRPRAGGGARRIPRRRQRAGQAAHDQSRQHLRGGDGTRQGREAAAAIEQALAFKEQQIKHAQGDAASFLLRLGAYRRAPELTKFRLQVETIEETLPGLQKFVRPGAGEMKDFDMWLLQPVGVGKSK